MVEFNRVTKIYDNLISAVYDVNFKINEGEFVFLIGPSGSGKTTIIKMLIRDEVPSEGKIFFNDLDITKISRKKVYKLRREIGVIFQDFKLVPDKTAYENVAFAMEAAGKKNKEIKETVPYVLDIVGLANRMKAFPRQLSGGEQQRVAIARAIANNPKILIADEPTGNLDPASSWDIIQVLTKINNWGTTVIMSTHGTDIVNSLNKRVIQMDKGRIIRDDNKGQYEMIQSYEDSIVSKIEIEDAPKSKKKTFQVKITGEEKDTITQSDKANSKEEKGDGTVHKLFNIFKKDRPRQEEDHITIMESLGEKMSEGKGIAFEKKEEKHKEKDTKKEKESTEEKMSDEPEDDKSAGIARSRKEDESEKNDEKNKKEHSEEDEEKIKKASKVNIDDLSLPKSVKSDLKTAGYKSLGDIIDAGPEELAKSLVIDPEEVILISKEIKKFMED